MQDLFVFVQSSCRTLRGVSSWRVEARPIHKDADNFCIVHSLSNGRPIKFIRLSNQEFFYFNF